MKFTSNPLRAFFSWFFGLLGGVWGWIFNTRIGRPIKNYTNWWLEARQQDPYRAFPERVARFFVFAVFHTSLINVINTWLFYSTGQVEYTVIGFVTALLCGFILWLFKEERPIYPFHFLRKVPGVKKVAQWRLALTSVPLGYWILITINELIFLIFLSWMPYPDDHMLAIHLLFTYIVVATMVRPRELMFLALLNYGLLVSTAYSKYDPDITFSTPSQLAINYSVVMYSVFLLMQFMRLYRSSFAQLELSRVAEKEARQRAVATQTALEIQVYNWQLKIRAFLHDLRPILNGEKVKLQNSWSISKLIGDIANNHLHVIPDDERKNITKSITELVSSTREDTADIIQRSLEELEKFQQNAKYISGEYTPSLKEASLFAVAEDAVDPLRHILQQRGINLSMMYQKNGRELEDPQADEIKAITDSDTIGRILSNLVNNANKFSEPGTTITVAVDQNTNSGDLVIKVIDQGRGIDANNLERIFESYTQVSEEDKREGYGIGLPTVRAMIGALGGQVFATSEGKGKGSTFTVILPSQN